MSVAAQSQKQKNFTDFSQPGRSFTIRTNIMNPKLNKKAVLKMKEEDSIIRLSGTALESINAKFPSNTYSRKCKSSEIEKKEVVLPGSKDLRKRFRRRGQKSKSLEIIIKPQTKKADSKSKLPFIILQFQTKENSIQRDEFWKRGISYIQPINSLQWTIEHRSEKQHEHIERFFFKRRRQEKKDY